MTAAQLDIIIGADVSQAVAAFEKVEKELEQTGKTAIVTSKEIGYIPKSFDEISATITKTATDFHNKWDKIVDDAQKLPPVIAKNVKEISLLEKQVQHFGGGVAAWNKFTPAVNNTSVAIKNTSVVVKKAGRDFTGLSRVIQDLPYGFNAISNNLTQLLPAAGAAGLAFSAVVSAISFAQMGFRNWTRSAGEAKQASEEFSKGLNSAKAGAIETGVKLQAFVNIAKDSTKSLADRNYALVEANKLMGEHGDKLTLANVSTKEITEQTLKFTQALIAQAVAGKYADKIADLIIKQAEASKAYGKALDQYNISAQKAADNSKQTSKDDQEDFYNIVKKNDAFSALVKSATNYKEITKDLSGTNSLFNETIQKSISLFADIGIKTDDNTKKVKDNTKAWEAWKAQMIKLNTQGIVLGSFQQEVQKLVGDQGKLTIRPSVTVAPFFDTKGLAAQAEALAGTIKDIVINALVGIGESIGNLISGIKNPFESLFNVIGGGIKALGKQMIEYAVLQKLMITSLSSLNPFLSAAVGVALVALGSVISNMGAVQKFATGGVVTSPTLALVGERGPERITPLGYENSASNMGIGVVQFELQGEKLYGVLKRYEKSRLNTF